MSVIELPIRCGCGATTPRSQLGGWAFGTMVGTGSLFYLCQLCLADALENRIRHSPLRVVDPSESP